MQALLAKPGGGRQWLLSLRDVPYREASEVLCELPGIGPKASLPPYGLPMVCLSFRHSAAQSEETGLTIAYQGGVGQIVDESIRHP